MRRIAIVGNGAAGKTYLANRLGERLGLPVVHLDALLYDERWAVAPPEIYAERQRAIVAGPDWIIEGNSLATLPIRLAAADTVVLVDPPTVSCLFGLVQRHLRYGGGQHPDGTFDRITWRFVVYVAWFRTRHRRRVLAALREHAGHATVIRLRSRRAVRAYAAGS